MKKILCLLVAAAVVFSINVFYIQAEERVIITEDLLPGLEGRWVGQRSWQGGAQSSARAELYLEKAEAGKPLKGAIVGYDVGRMRERMTMNFSRGIAIEGDLFIEFGSRNRWARFSLVRHDDEKLELRGKFQNGSYGTEGLSLFLFAK